MTAPSPLLAASTERLRTVLADHFVMWHELDGPIAGEWRCHCGTKFGFSDSAIDHQAEALRGVVVPAASLADDAALVERVADGVLYELADGGTREIAQAALRALTAALEDR